MSILPDYSQKPSEEAAPVAPAEPQLAKQQKSPRITSIDAARGLIMLVMIYVNDLAGAQASAHVPTWMQHASDVYGEMRRSGVKPLPAEDWLTFVDLVFPGFLFIVGMSIPFALGNRLNKGEGVWRILPHVLFRSLALIMLGVLMAAGQPDGTKMPWYRAPAVSAQAASRAATGAAPKLSSDEREKISAAKDKAGNLWIVFWYIAAFMAFCQLQPFWLKKDDNAGKRRWWWISLMVRVIGGAALLYLILLFERTSVNKQTHETVVKHLLTFSPFGFQYKPFDILGLIGCAYLMGSLVFLAFRNKRLPLAVCVGLLLGCWIATKSGSFDDFSLPGFLHPVGEGIASVVGAINKRINFQDELGSLPAITVAGILLATILWKPRDEAKQEGPQTVGGRVGFTMWFVAACCMMALLIHRPFLVYKNPGTPAWCLWACASTALVWLVFYLLGDVWKIKPLTMPFAVAGQNVLMAYLFSEAADKVFDLLHISDWYGDLGSPTLTAAISRSLGFAIFLLALTAGLNWLGLRLRL